MLGRVVPTVGGRLAEAGRENNFDFLRLAAATAVIVSHSFDVTGRPEPLLHATGYDTLGWLAVEVFFAVSGFLVTRSMAEGPGLAAFARNRALRILPGLAAAVLFAALVIGPLCTRMRLREYFSSPFLRDFFLGPNALHPTFCVLPGTFWDHPNNRVSETLWTLPMEAAMYVLVAAAGVCGLLSRRGRWAVAAAWAAAVLYETQWLCRPADEWWFELGGFLLVKPALKFGGCFLAGACLYLFRGRMPLSGLLAAAGVAALIASAKTDHYPLIRSVAVPYLSVWLALARLPGLAGWGRFGDFSYGLYLFAFPVQQAAVRFAGTGIGPAGVLAAGYPVALLLAWLSWRFVEKPALSLKARRAGGPEGYRVGESSGPSAAPGER